MTKKTPASPRRSACPINVALEIFGDRWSLLIVRDLMFRGRRTYKEFLSSEEGIATNILADRLLRLETEGIIEKRPDHADARRILYLLTEKGIALAPVLIEMIVWAARHEKTAAPAAIVRRMTQERESAIEEIRGWWKEARKK